MTALPKLSVITPTFNQGQFIEETILSVLEQGYSPLEYMVIDGGSTDNTLEILRKYERHIQWISEPDRGQSHALNKGLRRATGSVISFINSDDVYEPGALQKVGEFFTAHPQAAWLTGKCHTVDQNGEEIRRGVTLYKSLWLRTRSYKVLQVLDFISQPATFWRREVVEKVGLFNEKLHYAMDYEYSLRVGQHYKLSVIPEYLASYRIHQSSKAGASASAQFVADLEIAKSYASSRLFVLLHAIHNLLIVTAYQHLLFPPMNPAEIPVTGERSNRVCDQ